jgi:hypothetical protein
VSTVLRKNKTKLITPAELAAAQKRGAVVIDIRELRSAPCCSSSSLDSATNSAPACM